MELVNYTLNWIWEVMDQVLPNYPDICKCERCRYDIAALAANKLKTQYVVSHNGYVYSKTRVLAQQEKADVLAEVIKAINVVSQNPHHDDGDE